MGEPALSGVPEAASFRVRLIGDKIIFLSFATYEA